MVVRNDLDRYRLVMDVIDRVPGLAVRAAAVRQRMEDARLRHHDWIRARHRPSRGRGLGLGRLRR